MYAYRVRHTQDPDRRVLVTLPPDFPEDAFVWNNDQRLAQAAQGRLQIVNF